MLEAYAMPRQAPPTLSLTPPAASGSSAPACWSVIDRLAKEKMGEALKRCSDLGVSNKEVQGLITRLQTCYLELGACCLGGVLGEGSASEDTLPVSGLIKQVKCALLKVTKLILLSFFSCMPPL